MKTRLLPLALFQQFRYRITKGIPAEAFRHDTVLRVNEECCREIVHHVKTGDRGGETLQVLAVRPHHAVHTDGVAPLTTVLVKRDADDFQTQRAVLQVKFHEVGVVLTAERVR